MARTMEISLTGPPPLDAPLTFFVLFRSRAQRQNIFQNGYHGAVRVFLDDMNVVVEVNSRPLFRVRIDVDVRLRLISLVFGRDRRVSLFIDGLCRDQTLTSFPVLTDKFILDEGIHSNVESFAIVTEEVSAIKQAAIYNNGIPLKTKTVFTSSVIHEYRRS